MQLSFYNSNDSFESKKDLVISSKHSVPLSKSQQTFNRFIKKIEKLRTELKNTTSILDQKLDYYAKHIHPLEQQLISLRKECVKLLFTYLNNKNKKFFSNKEIKTLKEVVAIQVNEILSYDKSDEEIKKIFKAVNGISFEEAADQQLEEMKDEMEAMFESFGFDVDMQDLHNNMSEEEMMRKVKEIQEQFLDQEEKKRTQKETRKKTVKQLQKEERERQVEEARNRNISSMYKQLAKVLHPDLEQNEKLKAEKEALMKQLTSAYEKNDLHSLLRLELEWIHKEEHNAEKISDEKLTIYNQVLKEQTEELQEEINMVKRHPRYEPLTHYNNFFLGMFNPNSIDLSREKQNIEETLETLQVSISRLRGEKALKEVKDVIQIFGRQKKQPDFFDFFN